MTKIWTKSFYEKQMLFLRKCPSCERIFQKPRWVTEKELGLSESALSELKRRVEKEEIEIRWEKCPACRIREEAQLASAVGEV